MLGAEPASGCASARIFSSASVKRVRRAADDVTQGKRVRRQPRLGGDEGLDRRAADAQDLRLHVGGLRAELGVELLHLLLHPLRFAQPRVLVGRHAGVDVQARQFLVEARAQVEGVGQHLR